MSPLTLPPELPLRIVAEVTLKQPEKEKARGFFAWLNSNKEAVGVFAVIVGGLWTFYQYVQGEKDKVRLQREAAIVQFYGDLGNKDKRNTAAYGLATLSRERALPVLVPALKEAAVSKDDDPSFSRALSESLIGIGPVALEEIKKVNRDAGQTLSHGPDSGRIVRATQDVLEYFLRHRGELPSKDFSNLFWGDVDLSSIDATEVSFEGGNFRGTNFCDADLTGANLTGASLTNVNLGGANLSRANLTRSAFFDVELEGGNLTQVTGTDSRFEGNLNRTTFTQANLTQARFIGASLDGAKFSAAELSKADLTAVKAYKADFSGTNLQGVRLNGADLEGAKFLGANLEGTTFFWGADDHPIRPWEAVSVPVSLVPGNGAFVRGADFNGAKNVSGDLRRYLCSWGGKNIPGGCAGVSGVVQANEVERGMGGGSCW